MTIFQVFLIKGFLLFVVVRVAGKNNPLYIIRIDTELIERVIWVHDFMCPCRYILLNCNLSDNYAIARELGGNSVY